MAYYVCNFTAVKYVTNIILWEKKWLNHKIIRTII